MDYLSIEEIIIACNGKLLCGDKSQYVKGFSRDSREIKLGDIYVGIKGENFDGNCYYKQALENGAIGCIIEEHYEKNIEIESEKNIIIVKDSIKALQDIATYRRNQYNIPVVAVTGSVGKTSTKDIIANTLAQKYKVLKTEGNKNNHIGLPLTILELDNQEIITVEMGMNHLGEISVLTNIAKPSICVITNVGTAHIGNLGSRENILKAKLEILEGMDIPKIIINNDNDLLHNWCEDNKQNLEIHTFGIQNKSGLNAENIELREDGSEFVAVSETQNLNINVPVGGEHFVYNALCATEVGRLLDISDEQIKEGISKFELTKKRMDIRKLERE